jgi:hypothetical protein
MEDENEIQKEQTLTEYFSSSARPTLSVDVALYQSYLEDSGLSEAQKEEFLRALWGIVVSFVELGFDVHPLQEVCGQNDEIVEKSRKNGLNQESARNRKSEEDVRILVLDGMEVK